MSLATLKEVHNDTHPARLTRTPTSDEAALDAHTAGQRRDHDGDDANPVRADAHAHSALLQALADENEDTDPDTGDGADGNGGAG